MSNLFGWPTISVEISKNRKCMYRTTMYKIMSTCLNIHEGLDKTERAAGHDCFVLLCLSCAHNFLFKYMTQW